MDKLGKETQWIIRSEFPGLQTKNDASKVMPGALVAGQNTQSFSGSLSAREIGYENYPSSKAISTDTTKIQSIKTFRRRDGENILIRNQSSSLECFDETTIAWITIESGFTAGLAFGYAEGNINTDQQSFVYLCNSREPYMRWSGAHTHLTAPILASDTSIPVKDASGFPASGTIIIAGARKAYASRTNTSFTISQPAGTASPSGSAIVAGLQKFALAPRGNILLGNNNRMLVAGVTSVLAAVYLSRYGDASDFVGAALITGSTATSPAIFNLAEGGGSVVGMAFDEQATYIIKRNIIYRATLSDTLYTLTPLKPFDGKSQTTGGVSEPFAGENGIFFITPDKKIYHLTRLPQYDYPQQDPISDIIKTTVDALFFEKARGIVFEDKAFIACSSILGGENDRVLVYNVSEKLWYAPITGWNVTDWAIYRKLIGTKTVDQLLFASNNSKNVFKVTDTPVDGDFSVQAVAVMNQETFGAPAQQKYIDNFFFEGYIGENTEINISLLFNDQGFSQELNATISGTDTDILYSNESLNVFGSNPFGLELLGAVQEETGLKKFRVYTKEKLRVIPFYNIQLEFSSDGDNQQWSIINYGFKVGLYEKDEDRSKYIGFN